MQRRDHKMLAELLADEMGGIPYLLKKALILGSIEPDMNPFTYLHGFTNGEKFHGHNYENILVVMKKLFHSLHEEGGSEILKYYRLGKLMHYVEDAFTFPHNKGFCGSLKEHCAYEYELHVRFHDILQGQETVRMDSKGVNSFCQIEALHKEYLEKAGDCGNDCRYIFQVAVMVLRSQTRAVWYSDLMQMEGLAGQG